MSTYYTPTEIHAISQDVLRVYPAARIQREYLRFMWRGVGLPQARVTRDHLCSPLQSAVRSRSKKQLLDAANDIHDWGFGQPVPNLVLGASNFLPALLEVLAAFDGTTPAYTSMQESTLVALLSIPGLGIATVSKWICFMDQSRYGIFDSRVSIALRDVQLQDVRAFPVMGRRPLVGKQAFSSDTQILSSSTRTARAYLDYLAVLSSVARAVRLDAAEVEMALFMLGDVWADGQPPLRSLRRGSWK
ncbi:hypothetical protein [Ideonella sp. B508-1]|uniref:8-oxoguanine DNA glycosylase OGG fold protein n=1 Tax=Ideonella sp. B508-1 TaxID=137716 RepID=UPI0035B56171